jgi:molybdopterin/thiamine biosynthesis adenylyltransferase
VQSCIPVQIITRNENNVLKMFLLMIFFSFCRQIVHETKYEGMKKCDSAVERMKALNDSVKYTALDRKLSAGNAVESFEGFDLIVDATDNFEAR